MNSCFLKVLVGPWLGRLPSLLYWSQSKVQKSEGDGGGGGGNNRD